MLYIIISTFIDIADSFQDTLLGSRQIFVECFNEDTFHMTTCQCIVGYCDNTEYTIIFFTSGEVLI